MQTPQDLIALARRFNIPVPGPSAPPQATVDFYVRMATVAAALGSTHSQGAIPGVVLNSRPVQATAATASRPAGPTAKQTQPAAADEDKETGQVEQSAAAEDEEPEVYRSYRASKVAGPPHPDNIVETSTLAGADLPDPTYQHDLQECVDKGQLSDAQLEVAVYSNMRFNQPRLPSGERPGFFLGDGAGVGKGRSIAGVIRSHWQAGGRRVMWLSVSNDLKFDARRDLDDVGCGDIEVFPQGNSGLGKGRITTDGVLFITYSLLISGFRLVQKKKAARPTQDAAEFGEGGNGDEEEVPASGFSDPVTINTDSRLHQIVKWLGDGSKRGGEPPLIILDECHKAKNLINKGHPTKTGKAVLALQQSLPDAKVLYSSATGASEPRNLAYMTRIGSWGFRDIETLIRHLHSSGLCALELFSYGLKATGCYVSRSLSYNGAEFAIVPVTLEKQVEVMYDRASDLWSLITRISEQFRGCLPNARRVNYFKLLWGAHQRFFRQMLVAAKVPQCAREAQAALEAGMCVVIGLQSTGEAIIERAREEEGEGVMDDFISSPMAILRQFIDKHFPLSINKESEALMRLQYKVQRTMTAWSRLPSIAEAASMAGRTVSASVHSGSDDLDQQFRQRKAALRMGAGHLSRQNSINSAPTQQAAVPPLAPSSAATAQPSGLSALPPLHPSSSLPAPLQAADATAADEKDDSGDIEIVAERSLEELLQERLEAAQRNGLFFDLIDDEEDEITDAKVEQLDAQLAAEDRAMEEAEARKKAEAYIAKLREAVEEIRRRKEEAEEKVADCHRIMTQDENSSQQEKDKAVCDDDVDDVIKPDTPEGEQPTPARLPSNAVAVDLSAEQEGQVGDREDAGGKDESHVAAEEDVVCNKCKSADDDDKMLLCDGCDSGAYHLYCLSPPLSEVPEGDWYCPTCVEARTGGTVAVASTSGASSEAVQQRRRRAACIEDSDQDGSGEVASPSGKAAKSEEDSDFDMEDSPIVTKPRRKRGAAKASSDSDSEYQPDALDGGGGSERKDATKRRRLLRRAATQGVPLAPIVTLRGADGDKRQKVEVMAARYRLGQAQRDLHNCQRELEDAEADLQEALQDPGKIPNKGGSSSLDVISLASSEELSSAESSESSEDERPRKTRGRPKTRGKAPAKVKRGRPKKASSDSDDDVQIVDPAAIGAKLAAYRPALKSKAKLTGELDDDEDDIMMLDGDGERVNPIMARIKRMLLKLIASMELPANPLDQLIDILGGEDAVAEMTGRKGMLKNTEHGIIYERRCAEEAQKMINMKEKESFMSGKKLVAIISEAASTGISLHADKRVGNNRRRVHLTLELPWSADKAIQQFGRSHRSNQASAPIYKLLITKCGGEYRFASSAAKRLQSLGALLRGDRRSMELNLNEFCVDNQYGKEAIDQLYRDVTGQGAPMPTVKVPDLPANLVLPSEPSHPGEAPFFTYMKSQMCLAGLLETAQRMGMREYNIPNNHKKVDKFLNRLLGMKIVDQQLLFKYFMDIMEAKIAAAKSAGTYDNGIITLRASSAEIEENRLIHKDMTGAKTFWTKVKLDVGVSFDASLEAWKVFDEKMVENFGRRSPKSGFYVDPQTTNWGGTGHPRVMLAMEIPGQETYSAGYRLYRIMRPYNKWSNHMQQGNIAWRRVNDPERVRRHWEFWYTHALTRCCHGMNCQRKQREGYCDWGVRQHRVYLITGAVLPIWREMLEVTMRSDGGMRDREGKKLPNKVTRVVLNEETNQTIVGMQLHYREAEDFRDYMQMTYGNPS